VPCCHFIGSRGEIAETDLLVREFLRDQRLEPTGVLHAIGQRVADDGNMIALR
jgi:hypothetical protein